MAAEAEIYPPSSEAYDTPVVAPIPPLWRRISGGILMGLGGLIVAVFAALGVTVTLTFIDWRAALDGLATVLMVCGPAILLGALFAAAGRWLFGGWSSQAPMAFAGSYVLPVVGVIGAFTAIAIFFMALFDETGRGGAWALSQFLLSVTVSLGLVVYGLTLRRKRTR